MSPETGSAPSVDSGRGRPRQEWAQRMVFTIAEHLVKNGGAQMAAEYRLGATIPQLAERYVPAHVLSAKVAQAAVTVALRSLFSPEERAWLAAEHQKAANDRRIAEGHYESPQFLQQCRDAARRKHDAMSPEEKQAMVTAMLEARGHHPWTDAEKAFLRQLCESSENRYAHRPGPNFNRITEQFNAHFGSDRTVQAIRAEWYSQCRARGGGNHA